MSSTSTTQQADNGLNSARTSSLPRGLELVIPRPYKMRGGQLSQGTCYRVPEPLTIRFRSDVAVPPITDDSRQREIASAIWERLDNLIPKRSKALTIVMGIVLDQELVYPETFAAIDIVCGTVESCKAIQRELPEIHVGSDTGRVSIFKQHSWCPSLPSNVLPFDIYDWWLQPDEVAQLVKQVEQMAAPLGTLTGSVRFMMTTIGVKEPNRWCKVLRGHIMLSPETLQLSREEVNERKAFMFEGRNRIWYSECHLDYYKDWALRHPDRAARHEQPEGVAIGQYEACDDADNSEGGTSKKRKSNS